ncbi:MAG TPA: nitronate monooxygenase [Flavobacteriales bacterium]|nr:nitronate monooxygenase [Flavobacteriales bacterium]
MNTSNRVCALLGMELPIIQAGMVWCSGWELASAVSGAGGLGILGAGSMHPGVLRDQIQKVQAAAPGKPFAVNVPLLYPAVEEHMASIAELGVPIVFTSAGNPRTWTKHLQDQGLKVVHVVSSVKFALKAQEAGVDAVVAEGFEAGGHNGREETTTMCLVPAVADACDIPVIAAGGLHDGRSILAAMMLGAEAVQLGSRFVATPESSAHIAFKEAVLAAGEGATSLELKDVTPVRLLHNDFAQQVIAAQQGGATSDELRALLGRGRAKRGMFEGDLQEGELEIGQISAMLDSLEPAADLVRRLAEECRALGGAALGGRFDF